MEPVNENEDFFHLDLRRWEEDDEALAYYLATARYAGASVSPSVREELDRIEALAQQDSTFAARVDALRRRMANLDGGSSSASSDDHGESDSSIVSEPRPVIKIAASRPAESGARHRRLANRAIAIVPLALVAIAVSTVLFGPREQDIDSIAPIISHQGAVAPEMVLRGGSHEMNSELQIRFDQARAALESAERSFMGLVHWHDDTSLSRSADLFRSIKGDVQPDDPAHAASAYFLGRILLLEGNEHAAREEFEVASTGTGPYAQSAAESLRRLD